MVDRDRLEDQLFHTYSVRVDDLAVHGERLVSGFLTMYPHPEVRITLPPTWSEDPISEHNWRFQFHSLVWLDHLRQAYRLTGDPAQRDLYLRLLRSWIDLNPVVDPPSEYSWFDMAVGMRAIVLLHAVVELGDEPWLLESMILHGEFLADDRNYDARGNHGLHQDMGLVALAHYLDRDDWLALAQTRISSMFLSSIDEEGVCREGSIDYQYKNYRWFAEAETRLTAAGARVPLAMATRLPKMTEFLAHATNPAGEYLLIGDTVQHIAPRTEGTATMWPVDSSWAPIELTKVYSAGYVFTRSAWETWDRNAGTSLIASRFGPGRTDAVHGHEDAGAILLEFNGESLLRDSGLFAYEAGEERLYFRGRSSHNVVDVPGRKFYPSASAELVEFQDADEGTFWTIRMSAIQGTVWHRSVLVLKGYDTIIVDDRLVVHGGGAAVQRWHVPPGAHVK